MTVDAPEELDLTQFFDIEADVSCDFNTITECDAPVRWAVYLKCCPQYKYLLCDEHKAWEVIRMRRLGDGFVCLHCKSNKLDIVTDPL